MRAELERLWRSVERTTIVPGVTAASILAEGATAERLRMFEESIGITLPTEIRESYARHNGQREGAGYYAFSGANFLSLDEVVRERQRRMTAALSIFGPLTSAARLRPSRVEGPAQRELWIDEWIPVLKRNKEPICADLRPAPGGSIGQLVEVDWEGGNIRVIASSFTEFLRGCSSADA